MPRHMPALARLMASALTLLAALPAAALSVDTVTIETPANTNVAFIEGNETIGQSFVAAGGVLDSWSFSYVDILTFNPNLPMTLAFHAGFDPTGAGPALDSYVFTPGGNGFQDLTTNLSLTQGETYTDVALRIDQAAQKCRDCSFEIPAPSKIRHFFAASEMGGDKKGLRY